MVRFQLSGRNRLLARTLLFEIAQTSFLVPNVLLLAIPLDGRRVLFAIRRQ
jgi:hypothetical protein